MPSINFEQYFKTLESGVSDVAKETVSDFMSQGKQDGQNVLNLMKADLERWTIEVSNGEMSLSDFEFLVKAEKELDEMDALKEAGIAAIDLDKFKNGLISLTINTLSKLL